MKLANLTRMWLTRSKKPFVFENKYENKLDFDNCSNLGLYVHIPFCRTICNFCPYCKEKYNKEKSDKYIKALLNEIHMVGKQAKYKKVVSSVYFGGGSPAILYNQIGDIINTLKKYFIITEGIGIELHPEDIKEDVLKILKEVGITKISIGIQSFQNKYQKILGRQNVDINKLKELLEKTRFETVSIDLIFALPKQTFKDIKKDIDIAFNIGANHIAIYPFIDFTFTKSKVNEMNKKQKRQLLDKITIYCFEKGYKRNSIWTFAKEESACYSSMTRENFLGFGVSATTLLKDTFKVNTFSISEYCKRIENNNLPTSLTTYFTKYQRMIYYLFWTAYSTKVDSKDFKKFFGVELKRVYGLEIFLAKKLGFITEENGVYKMTLKGAFYYHYYENFYTLSYIDKMWKIMRKEAFPLKIEL